MRNEELDRLAALIARLPDAKKLDLLSALALDLMQIPDLPTKHVDAWFTLHVEAEELKEEMKGGLDDEPTAPSGDPY